MRSLMGTELMRICVKEDNDDFPSVPPGFESYTSFALKRVEANEKDNDKNLTSSSTSASESQSTQVGNGVQISDTAKVSRSLRRRPWINHGQCENGSEEDCDCERHDQNFSSRPCLPKGVIRGCPDCPSCQKVIAKWRPEEALRPHLEDAPVFYPTEEEFQDTLKYISSIRSRAEPYGICRIVPPQSWKPPCPLKEKSIWEGSKFATRVQRIDKLQNRNSGTKKSRIQNNLKRKRRRCTRMGVDNGTESDPNAVFCEVERFGFEPGPEFTLETFKRYADEFKVKYFRNDNLSHPSANTTIVSGTSEPSVENIEGEYWRMVESPTEEIEVLYGADLETGVFGSGFPINSSQVSDSNQQYIKSGWNLNNFARLPGSLLSYETSDISGVVVPWLYLGMCFSSFCWHVEDHHLYSLNYMHWGAPKMWYGVAAKDACKLEEVMRKHLPELFEEQPDLLHKLVTQLSPSILKSKGVPVYRCVQNPGDFVLTFPRAYHSGFNCGFNCAEAVNVAPVDWLRHGHIAIDLYREQRRKTSISHDKLLLGAAREAVRAQWEITLLKKNTTDNLKWKDVCGKDGLLASAFKARVETERVKREFLCSSSKALKMESSFDATSERECSICFFDLHLSAAACHCSTDRYACLDHAKQFCSCSWSSRFFLFRYDISELNVLVEALEGKLSAVYRWAKSDLGLALTSYISLDKKTIIQELKLHPSNKFIDNAQSADVPIVDRAYLANIKDQSYLKQKKSAEAVSPLSHKKELSTFNSSKPTHEMANRKIRVIKEESVSCISKPSAPVCELNQEDSSYALSPPLAQHGDEKSSHSKPNVILLSDDEDDEMKTSDSNRRKEVPHMLAGSRNKASPCSDIEYKSLTIPVTDASVTGEKDAIAVHREASGSSSTKLLHVKQECHEQRGPVLPSTPVDLSFHIGLTSTEPVKSIPASSRVDAGGHSLESLEVFPPNPQPSGPIKAKNEDNHEKFVTLIIFSIPNSSYLGNMGVLEIILRVSFVAMFIKLAMATNHIVGGPNGGWDTSSDLQSWASSQQISVGDNLIFNYPPNHDVVEVTKPDYDSCQQTNPIQSYNDGATTITLTSQGKRYFICGTIGHCNQGMKVEIDTLATQISPASPAPAAESPSISDSPIISIIPSAAPEESIPSPAESPDSKSPLFEPNMESPTFSPVIPSTEFLAPSSPLAQHSQDVSASSTEKGNLQAFISIVLSFVVVFIAFF